MILSAQEFLRLRTSDDPNEYLRAAHDTASDEVWFAVLSNFPDMAFWVAQNKTISENIIKYLTFHTDAHVRSMIARKRRTPLHILEHLSSDADESVRMSVVYNAKVNGAILRRLADDELRSIREAAQTKLEGESG